MKCRQHRWLDVTTMEQFGYRRMLVCAFCGAEESRRRYWCGNCGWNGETPSMTEDKLVTEIEGMVVVERPVYPVCPECFNRVAVRADE